MIARFSQRYPALAARLTRERKELAATAPDNKATLGAHAKRLLDDPTLTLAFELIERDLLDTIRNSRVGEAEQREAAYRMIWAKEQVRAKLRKMAGDAKMIEAEMKRREAAETA